MQSMESAHEKRKFLPKIIYPFFSDVNAFFGHLLGYYVLKRHSEKRDGVFPVFLFGAVLLKYVQYLLESV